jgi:hypothetical protein
VAARATDKRACGVFKFSQIFQSQLKHPTSKFKNEIFPASKNYEQFGDDRVINGNNFPYWSKFKIKTDFELEIQKLSRN